MRTKQKRRVLSVLFVIAFLLISGCQKKKPEEQKPELTGFMAANQKIVEKRAAELSGETAITINNQKISMIPAMFLIYSMEVRGNYYALYQELSETAFWNSVDEETGKRISELTKEQMIDTLVQYAVLNDCAEKNGLVLSKEDLSGVTETVSNIKEALTAEETERGGFTEENLYETGCFLKLADKYYDKMTENLPVTKESVASELNKEEYEEYKTSYLYYPTTYYSDDFSLCEETEENKQIARERMEELYLLAKQGDSFDVLAEQEKKTTVNTRTFLVNGLGAEDAYRDAAKLLQNGEISMPVQTEYGIYLIRMEDRECSETYDAKVDELFEQKRSEAFAAAYEVLRSEYQIEVNQEAFQDILLGATVSYIE